MTCTSEESRSARELAAAQAVLMLIGEALYQGGPEPRPEALPAIAAVLRLAGIGYREAATSAAKRAVTPKEQGMHHPEARSQVVDEVERGVFEAVFKSKEDANGAAQHLSTLLGNDVIVNVLSDDEDIRHLVHVDLQTPAQGAATALRLAQRAGITIGLLTGWRIAAEGG